MIACAWVESLTGTDDENAYDNAEEYRSWKMCLTSAGLGGWSGHERIDGQQTHLYRKTNDFFACSQA